MTVSIIAGDCRDVLKTLPDQSADCVAWRDEAGWVLKSQKPHPLDGRVTVDIDLVNPDRVRRDASNHIKAVEDLLVAHGIIAGDDDRTVRRVSAQWVDTGPACLVTITPVEAE